tara:strand:- start:673 stop:837 length:165 start_codon:yes stop_codon:yes gene_type:complete
MDRISRKVLNYIKDIEKKTKQMNFVKFLKKEVHIGANGTQGYVIKKGSNKGKIL